jgi:glycosidase
MYENIKNFFVFDKITTDEFYEIIYKSNQLNDKEFSLTYFIENHDIPRFIDICKNKENFYDAMKILFSLSGNILLEYGNEFCIKGDSNYKYFSESGRVPMKFKNKFSNEEKEVFEFTKKLINLRKENESLSKGNYEKIYSDKNTLIIKKSYKEDNCYILLAKIDTKFNENYYDIINEIEYPSSYILKKGVYILKRR